MLDKQVKGNLCAIINGVIGKKYHDNYVSKEAVTYSAQSNIDFVSDSDFQNAVQAYKNLDCENLNW